MEKIGNRTVRNGYQLEHEERLPVILYGYIASQSKFLVCGLAWMMTLSDHDRARFAGFLEDRCMETATVSVHMLILLNTYRLRFPAQRFMCLKLIPFSRVELLRLLSLIRCGLTPPVTQQFETGLEARD